MEADCRFLLFAHHQAVMDTMQQTLEKMKAAGCVEGNESVCKYQEDEIVDQLFLGHDLKATS